MSIALYYLCIADKLIVTVRTSLFEIQNLRYPVGAFWKRAFLCVYGYYWFVSSQRVFLII